MDLVQTILAALSGALVGFSLSLVGGGGSILAVPLMVYLVGVPQPHVAIGTSALAVAANAALGLFNHARAGHVKWRCGLLFAAAGIAGAFAGSTAGKAFDGQKLLFLFALVMIAVGILMLRRRGSAGNGDVRLGRENAGKLSIYGLGAGAFSGFFGIGGGFLIVPGLIAATDMAMINAVGTSLVAVTSFGLTTSLNYAASGLINWALAGVFVAGGLLGSTGGLRLAKRLSAAGTLSKVFAGLIFAVAAYMLWKSGSAAFG
ncbi:sulfite exporter TauE/SafE family protein [Sphingomonas sp. HDW15A]|uniref:sulfite exporter TauE/SafE family protein n=1 Tax=Sphingomonas sp. HDW15A TaxID=2714942 RepID=UPI00140ADA19|nr:sulfite exporter TauE/SafE family protein [Sphingomonas sp. HDW15A]QIK96482.1 sulfite exporter TauE/SafE family protein [Sphingomonas sp. HDW15A]